jgi:hypothetical protein
LRQDTGIADFWSLIALDLIGLAQFCSTGWNWRADLGGFGSTASFFLGWCNRAETCLAFSEIFFDEERSLLLSFCCKFNFGTNTALGTSGLTKKSSGFYFCGGWSLAAIRI